MEPEREGEEEAVAVMRDVGGGATAVVERVWVPSGGLDFGSGCASRPLVETTLSRERRPFVLISWRVCGPSWRLEV